MHTSRAPQRGWTVQWDRWRILCVADDGFIRSFLDLLDVNEVVGDGIDGETGDAVDSEFAGDVLAMREHRVEGDEKFSRNFFVRHAADNAVKHFPFALGEIAVGRDSGHCCSGRLCTVHAHPCFQDSDGRHEDAVLHETVETQVVLAGENVKEHGVKEFGASRGSVVANDDVLEFLQFGVDAAVDAGIAFNAVVLGDFPLQQSSDIGKDPLVLVLHVLPHLPHVVVIVAKDVIGNVIGAGTVQCFEEFAPDGGKLEVEELVVCAAEIVSEAVDGELFKFFGQFSRILLDEIGNGDEGEGIDTLFLANLCDRLVAHPEGETEACHQLKQSGLVADEFRHGVRLFVFSVNHGKTACFTLQN